jgi:hypothetical protein
MTLLYKKTFSLSLKTGFNDEDTKYLFFRKETVPKSKNTLEKTCSKGNFK